MRLIAMGDAPDNVQTDPRGLIQLSNSLLNHILDNTGGSATRSPDSMNLGDTVAALGMQTLLSFSELAAASEAELIIAG